MKDESNEIPSWETERYRRQLARLEAKPENQNGADKTWVERCVIEWREHYRRAVRKR